MSRGELGTEQQLRIAALEAASRVHTGTDNPVAVLDTSVKFFRYLYRGQTP
jgi:hypothetical protein